MEKEKYVIKIRDIEYASLLKAMKFELEEMQWDEKGDAYWTFSDPELKSEKVINKYINNKIKGDLKKFKDAEKSLRQMLFSKKEINE